MLKILDPSIIDRFRTLMNHRGYAYNQYSDDNGTNYYNLICSQMDWIESWVSEIENITFNFDNASGSYRDTINTAQFILGIDTIITATKSLLDLFKFDYKEIMESKVMLKKEVHENLTDFEYFKRIRSSIAIHPTDIFASKTKKYFASWVSTANVAIGWPRDTFVAFIYSSKSDEKDAIELLVNRTQLLHFAAKWYNKIDDLNEHLEPIIKNETV